MNRIIRNLALAAAFFCCLGGLHAQDTICMTWTEENNPVYTQYFRIKASLGEKFIVDYGNGDKEDTLTGLGAEMNATYDWIYISHTYTNWQSQYTITITSLTEDCKFYVLYCSGLKLTNLSISSLTLTTLFCSNNRLTTFDLSRLPALSFFHCDANSFLLSECDRLRKNYPQCGMECNWHNLPPQEIEVGEAVDFSSETEFDGVPTDFDIRKNGILTNTYLINNGIILFKDTGTYNVIMSYSTEQYGYTAVGVEIHVTSDATLSYLRVSHGELEPAFDNVIFDYSVEIGYDTNYIYITARAKDTNTIINGDIGYQKLQVGSNVFTVLTTLDTTTKTYTITVNRESDVGIEQLTMNNEQLIINNIEIYNILGQKLQSLQSLQSYQQAIEALPTGMYIIKINNKIIKLAEK